MLWRFSDAFLEKKEAARWDCCRCRRTPFVRINVFCPSFLFPRFNQNITHAKMNLLRSRPAATVALSKNWKTYECIHGCIFLPYLLKLKSGMQERKWKMLSHWPFITSADSAATTLGIEIDIYVAFFLIIVSVDALFVSEWPGRSAPGRRRRRIQTCLNWILNVVDGENES